MAEIDYDNARNLISACFVEAEHHILAGTRIGVAKNLVMAFDRIFQSSTQAYREVLIGCLIARMADRTVDIRLPYVGLGENSFNGRDIDEKVVNPLLHEKRVPCSRGPYLSVFRRSVHFDQTIRSGLRDKEGYDAFLTIVGAIEAAPDDNAVRRILKYAIFKFTELREASVVPLSRLRRTSLEQCDALITGLLGTPSGGRFPALLVAAAFKAIQEAYGLNWTIECQGINVADRASGAGGDITIRVADRIVLAAEVTERTVDRSRVVATFNTKIAPAGIEDYLFFVTRPEQEPDVLQQVRQYFSQGHEVNFIEIRNWIVTTLGTLGVRGRALFCQELANRLDQQDVPKPMKVSWNEQIDRITATQ